MDTDSDEDAHDGEASDVQAMSSVFPGPNTNPRVSVRDQSHSQMPASRSVGAGAMAPRR
ncbi:hypothetical protein PSAB6_60075 [Paraburkholderia sabiae]|nr:hypothetical protein PSAB6_60075 [Paraburkholderia sabiae]